MFYQESPDINQPYTTTYDALKNFKLLNLNTDNRGPVILFLDRSKHSIRTKELWNQASRDKDLPSFKYLMKFLEEHFRHLEDDALEKRTFNTTNSNPKTQNLRKKTALQTNTETKFNTHNSCKICQKGSHHFRLCEKFNVGKKWHNLVKSLGVCFNCFSYSHQIPQCSSLSRCFHCHKKHHSLLPVHLVQILHL